MNPIENILRDFPVLILDGAFATELERYGHDLNDPLWSAKVLMEDPLAIVRVHADYFAAGSDCIITASYQATFEGFIKRGLAEHQAADLIRSSIVLARKARDDFWKIEDNRKNRPRPIVAASIGPYGAYLADGSEYHGDYGLSEEELASFHFKRLKTIQEASPDLLACETIPCMREAKALVGLLEQSPETYCWVSFSAKDGYHINSGEKIVDCAKWLDAYPQVAAVGVNCTAPEYVASLISEIKKGTDKPIVVYPNSGELYDTEMKTWIGTGQSFGFGKLARQWFELGARLIGGCCRTTPNDIREIVAWARQ